MLKCNYTLVQNIPIYNYTFVKYVNRQLQMCSCIIDSQVKKYRNKKLVSTLTIIFIGVALESPLSKNAGLAVPCGEYKIHHLELLESAIGRKKHFRACTCQKLQAH